MSTRTVRKPRRAPVDLSQQAHRRLVGILGLSLPLLLYLMAGLRPTMGLTDWKLLPSVSAYYYTGGVAFFVGILFALALFLLTYRGYEGEIADRVVGFLGGCGALGVAIFPTSAPVRVSPASWWSEPLEKIHYMSAVVLFLSFIAFSIWLFRKSNIPRKADRPLEKRIRNNIYLGCGIAMIIGVLWAGSSLFTKAPIFWAETMAIVGFAISWLVKGEADAPIRRMYGRWRGRAR